MGDASRDGEVSTGDTVDRGSAGLAWFEGALDVHDILAGCDAELTEESVGAWLASIQPAYKKYASKICENFGIN